MNYVASAHLLLAGIIVVAGEIAPFHKAVENVANSYIIRIKKGYDVDTLANELEDHAVIRRSGARLTHRYKRSFKGLAAYLPTNEAVDAVRNLDGVEYVAENGVVSVASFDGPVASSLLGQSDGQQSAANDIPWGLDRIDQAELPLDGIYNPLNDGEGVTVYVVDSGVLVGHREFEGRATVGLDAYGKDGIDCTGHGTHVAAVVGGVTYGVAKKVSICDVRVVGGDCDTNGSVADVIAGIDWISGNIQTPAVVTLSLNMYGVHVPLTESLDGLIEDTGVTVVVAAGNMDDDACDSSPSSNEQVITVGASDVDDTRWPSSNWGSCVDLFAPGVGIVSADCTGPTDTKQMSGTSEACPYVAGAAAILLAQDPSLSHADIKERLLHSATPNVLRFNQGNTTEQIEPTPNLLLRVRSDSTHVAHSNVAHSNVDESNDLWQHQPLINAQAKPLLYKP